MFSELRKTPESKSQSGLQEGELMPSWNEQAVS
jgi:hypothetical protein